MTSKSRIPLTRGLYAVVDAADHDTLAAFKWYAHHRSGKRYYAARRLKLSTDRRRDLVLMHRVIAGAPPHLMTDHINGDTLDNRRQNLRACTPQENVRNRRALRLVTRLMKIAAILRGAKRLDPVAIEARQELIEAALLLAEETT